MGLKDKKISRRELSKIIYCLNIDDHEGQVYFPEVLWSIAYTLLGDNGKRVADC
jgi:hypothetical protein